MTQRNPTRLHLHSRSPWRKADTALQTRRSWAISETSQRIRKKPRKQRLRLAYSPILSDLRNPHSISENNSETHNSQRLRLVDWLT